MSDIKRQFGSSKDVCYWSQGSCVNIDTKLRSGRPRFTSWQGAMLGFLRTFRLWGPPSFLSSGYWRLLPRG